MKYSQLDQLKRAFMAGATFQTVVESGEIDPDSDEDWSIFMQRLSEYEWELEDLRSFEEHFDKWHLSDMMLAVT